MQIFDTKCEATLLKFVSEFLVRHISSVPMGSFHDQCQWSVPIVSLYRIVSTAGLLWNRPSKGTERLSPWHRHKRKTIVIKKQCSAFHNVEH